MTLDTSKVLGSFSYVNHDGVLIDNGHNISIYGIGNGSITINNNQCYLALNQILHTPYAINNHLFVQKVCANNDVFIEFHYDLFYVKDKASRMILFQGESEGSPYKLSSVIGPKGSMVPPRDEKII